MSDESVTASITGHMELLNKTFLWSLALAATLIISVLSPTINGSIKIIGLDVSKPNAYLLAGFGFIFANSSIFLIALRVRDLFQRVSDGGLIETLLKVSILPIFLNPFTDFGPPLRARLHSSLSLAVLILLWWGCFTSVSMISRFAFGPLEVFFILSALVSLQVFDSCSRDLIQRLSKSDKELANELWDLRTYRIAFGVASSILGAVINVFFEAFYRPSI